MSAPENASCFIDQLGATYEDHITRYFKVADDGQIIEILDPDSVIRYIEHFGLTNDAPFTRYFVEMDDGLVIEIYNLDNFIHSGVYFYELVHEKYDVASPLLTAPISISPSTNWTDMPHNGGKITFTVTNLPRDRILTIPNWVNHTIHDNVITLTVQPNTSLESRSCTFRIICMFDSRNSVSLAVTQRSTPIVTLTPHVDWLNIPYTAGNTRTVTMINAPRVFSITSPNFINHSERNHVITLTTLQNNSTASRRGYLRVRCVVNLSNWAGFDIIQQGAPRLTISPPTNWTVPATAGN